jgi:hypothetical protein
MQKSNTVGFWQRDWVIAAPLGDNLVAVDLPFYSATIRPWVQFMNVQGGCVATRTTAVVFKGRAPASEMRDVAGLEVESCAV